MAAKTEDYRQDWQDIRQRRKPPSLAVSLELGTLRQYQVLLERQQDIPRAVFQRKLGQLFGYSAEDIADFVGSELSQSCKCTLCGRDDIAAAAAARRTQYHA